MPRRRHQPRTVRGRAVRRDASRLVVAASVDRAAYRRHPQTRRAGTSSDNDGRRGAAHAAARAARPGRPAAAVAPRGEGRARARKQRLVEKRRAPRSRITRITTTAATPRAAHARRRPLPEEAPRHVALGRRAPHDGPRARGAGAGGVARVSPLAVPAAPVLATSPPHIAMPAPLQARAQRLNVPLVPLPPRAPIGVPFLAV